MTRFVSLVDKLELDFQGTIYRNAIAFGDVDNDGGNELVVCSTSGQLFIFKGSSSKPWRVCTEGLGCVTTVLVSDVTNCKSPAILCLNTEGHCFVFNQSAVLEKIKSKQNERTDKEKQVPNKGAKSSPLHSTDILIKPSFVQDLPANPKMAVVTDLNGDGLNELIICYTDRYVRVFRFKHPHKPQEGKQQKEDFLESTGSHKKLEQRLSKQSLKDEDGKPSLSTLGKQPSKDSESSKTPSPLTPNHGHSEQKFTFDDGRFEELEEFYLPGQIGSVAAIRCQDNKTKLIASQPGGGYMVLRVYGQADEENLCSNENVKPKKEPLEANQVAYTNPGFPYRNFNVNCEVIGSIKREHEMSGLFCLCTLDGFFALVDAGSNCNRLLPTVRTTEYQWFSLNTMELKDGNDAVVICSWEGVTYVINKDLELASYNYGNNVCGFGAGLYAVEPQNNIPCFCYVTYANKIVLYYDVSCIYQKSNSLGDALLEKLKTEPEMGSVLVKLTNRDGKIDHSKLAKLIQSTS